jgi:mitochondrial fission protein ELM1
VDKADDTVHSFVRETTMHDTHHRPLIWVLKGLRQGDNAQAMALALQIGGRVETKQLGFNRLHVLPNWLAGAGVGHLTPETRKLLRPPWPHAVVATGRRTARVALWIKTQSGGHTKLIQIGRPRMNVNAFDVVVTTPQYGLPLGGSVMDIALPFAIPKTVAADELQHFTALWHDLPRPWVLGVIGGGKFPLRLTSRDLQTSQSVVPWRQCDHVGFTAIPHGRFAKGYAISFGAVLARCARAGAEPLSGCP